MKLDKFKKQQALYYRKKWGNPEFFHSKPTPVNIFFSKVALDKLVKLWPLKFAKKKVLVVCGGGGGLEIKKMQSLNVDLTVSDISPEALKEVKKICPNCKTVLADAEKLFFNNDSFEMGLVKDGLHHLPNPEVGIKELLRVCTEGVFIIDFQETLLTKLLTKVGFSPEYEEAGNPNFRFSRHRLVRLFSELGIKNYKIKSYFVHAPVFKAAIFQTRVGFILMKAIFYSFNFLFSRWGNVLMMVVIKNDDK